MSQNVVNPYRFVVLPVVYGTITGDGGDGEDNRVQKALGFTLSDTLWVTEFEIESTAQGAFVLPVCFSQNTGVVAETGASNNAMGFYLDNNWDGFEREGSTFRPTGYIAGTDNSPRYITMLRESATELQINVYTNEARTDHDESTCGGACSEYSGILNITVASGVTDLAYIQSSTECCGHGDHQAYTVTDIKVWDGTNDTSEPIDFHGTATGWTTIPAEGGDVTIA